ncbi:MAG TPA: methylated-DNA--[protein]-cysteine S-methyltransferase [Quisquiliibacterium sp.]|nr:methylated-DNA--[protein]-cysteine S-methyltransferase [Quisquiliibacterium sp.]
MNTLGLCLFDTALGPCGIAWGEAGLTGVQLPEADAAATRARMRARFPGVDEIEPPAEVRDAIARIVAALRGEPDDLRSLRLDMQGIGPFQRRVYELLRALPYGATTTYGELAARLGEPGASRAVGRALGDNPFAPVVPCHRVLAAGRRSGGFSAGGGVATKLRMLAIERARFGEQPGLFDD